MKKAIYSLFFILLIGAKCIVGQNSPQLKSWNIAPNTVTFNSQPLLGALPIGSYAGSASYSLINSMHDPYGNLLFFVINENDGSATGNALKIFDKDGNLIDDIKLDIHQGNSYRYWAEEMSIVPVPNSCNKYYLITAATDVYNYTSQHGDFYPLYSILDMDSPNIYDPTKKGALTYYPASNPTNAVDMSSVNITPFANAYIDNVWRPNRLGIGVTPYRGLPANNHLLFVNSALGIFTYTITSNGLFYNNNPFNFPSNNSGNSFYSELEVVMLPNGNYRLAKVLSSTIINVADFDFNGNYILGSFKSIDLVNSISTNVDDVKPTSLEFSPNGQYLYFSHNIVIGVSNFNIPVHYLDLNATILNAIPFPSNYLGINDLEGAHIEMAHDCKMYFNSGTQLYALSNPNNPLSGSWQSSVTLLPDNNGSFTKRLPDQMDGEDYQRVNYSSMHCCIETTKFTASSYTANITDGFSTSKTQIWTPTNNPFIRLHNDLYPCDVPVTSLSTITIKGDLIIPEGYNITIQGLRFEFAPRTGGNHTGLYFGGRVVVKNGNTVTPAGGRLTLTSYGNQIAELTVYNGCGVGLWEGVEVWGDAISAQGTFTGVNSGVNGWIRLYNASTISRAYFGVLAGKKDPSNYIPFITPSYGGGVVQAGTNTTFANNIVDVQLMPYNTGNSQCFFTSAIFITNSPIYLDGNTTTPIVPEAHVVLKDVKNIIFKGCKFYNTITAIYPQTLLANKLIGIKADHSHFSCLPVIYGSSSGCVFNNLKYGIYATFHNKTKTITVDFAKFTDNYRGIYLNSAQLVPTITRNNFNILSYNTTVTNNRAYGLYMNACTNYKVEENYFTTTNGNDNANNIGIVVNNSGPYSNRIYKNTFNILWAGIQTQNLNCHINQTATIVNDYGLKLLCNNYSVIKNFDMGITTGGIDYFQGNSTLQAGNRFSHSGNNSNNDYYSYGGSIISNIRYYHNFDISYTPQPGFYTPAPTILTTNSGTSFNPATQCLSSFNNYHLTAPLDELKNNIVIASNNYNNYKTLLDEGASPSLLQSINNTNLSFGNLKNLLSTKSPYLSDEILIAYLNKPGIPAGHINDIVCLNSPITEQVKAVVDNLNLPIGIKNQIQLAQNSPSISERQKAEELLLYYQYEIEFVKNEILREYVNDSTTEIETDTIIWKIKNYENIDDIGKTKDKELLADFYIEKSDFINADSIIQEFENDATKRNVGKLKRIHKSIKQNGNNFFSLSNDIPNKLLVDEILQEETVQGYETAIGIKQSLNDSAYIEPIEDMTQLHRFIQSNNETEQSISGQLLFPNPSSGQLFLKIQTDYKGEGVFRIFDVMGRNIINCPIISDKELQQFDLKDLNNGIYIYQIEIDGIKKDSDRLIIIK